MRPLIIAVALACAAAVPVAPVHATVETPEAKAESAELAEQAREHMRKVFRKKRLDNGAFLWREGFADGSIDRVVIGLGDQMIYAYSDGRLVAVSTISSGKAGTPTPTGIFPVLEKRRKYFSRKYDNAPMPFMQRIDQYGIALHGGHLPGFPASHGCIRLPHEFAARLFGASQVEGTVVYIGD